MPTFSCFIQIKHKNAKFLILIIDTNKFFFKIINFVYLQKIIIFTFNKKIPI